jgi:hypothetical protein
MKVRLKGDSIRLRLTQSEVKQLSEREAVLETVHLTPVNSLSFSLETWHLKVPSIKPANHHIRISLPATEVMSWFDDKNRLELTYRLDNGQSKGLTLLVEKDLACLSPRPEETDQFPHPQAGRAKC